MSEREPNPPRDGEVELSRTGERVDLRRLEVAYDRFEERIQSGIAKALAEQTEIGNTTARCIAHVLGRAYDRESALADFGRTGEGNYLTVRDEYLAIYNDEHATAVTKQIIDWLGTHLVHRENTGSGRQFMNEHLPPRLPQLLVRTSLHVDGQRFTVNVPADWDSGHEDDLIETLTDLRLSEDPGLQAFLSLPNVSAGSGDIMASFHEAYAGTYIGDVEALHALSPLGDWEDELADWCIDHGVDFDALEWNYEPLIERLRTLYDLVEQEGCVYAFTK